MSTSMTKCPVDSCKSYFVCQEDLEEHKSLHYGNQPATGATRLPPDGREATLSAASDGYSIDATSTNSRLPNATTRLRSTASPGSATPKAGLCVTGNENSQVLISSATSNTDQKSFSVTGNKRSQVLMGSLGSSSASGNWQNGSGGISIIGNKGTQAVIGSSGRCSSSGQGQSGRILISDNEKLQLISNGSRGGEICVANNVDLQVLHGTGGPAAAVGGNVEDNTDSQVLISGSGNEGTSGETCRANTEGEPEIVPPQPAQD